MQRHTAIHLSVVFAVTLLLFQPEAGRASCGALTCPIGRFDEQAIPPGTVVLDYSYQYVDQSEARIGTDKASIGQIRGHHDEVFTVSRIHTLSLETPLLSRLRLYLSIPFVSREHQHIHNHRGRALLESWNLSGIGDLTMLTRWMVLKSNSESHPMVFLNLGGKLPTGKSNGRGTIQQDTFLLASDVAEPGIQPGTGAYDFLSGISAEMAPAAPMLTRSTGACPCSPKCSPGSRAKAATIIASATRLPAPRASCIRSRRSWAA